MSIDILKKAAVEAARNIVDTARFRGEDVRFRREVDKYRRSHVGASEKEAQKILLDEKLHQLSEEIRLRGTLPPDSRAIQRLAGALRETLGDFIFAKLRERKPSGGWMMPPIDPVEKAHIVAKKRELKDYFTKKHKKIPPQKIQNILDAHHLPLQGSIEAIRRIQRLADRFRAQPQFISLRDIAREARRNPDLLNDLGQLLRQYTELRRHIREFEKRIAWERSRALLVAAGKKAIEGAWFIIREGLKLTARGVWEVGRSLFRGGGRMTRGLFRELDSTLGRAARGPFLDEWYPKKKKKKDDDDE